MRIVLAGLNHMSIEAARQFMEDGADVILIDPDKERFEELAGDLDIAFLQGDGGRPEVLADANPEDVDVMYCLADDDKDNIIAALVGRAAGAERVIPKIEDRSYDPICDEIGLKERIDPDRSVARALVNMVGKHEDGLETEDVEAEEKDEDQTGGTDHE